MNSRIGTSELIELLIAFVVLTVAFSFMFAGVRIFNPSFDNLTAEIFFIAAVGVGSGFLLHELAHKFTAMRYGYYAEFKTSPNGLLLTIGSALFGFLFAAPGAVYISRPMYESYGSGTEIAGNPNDDQYWDNLASRRGDDKDLKISIAGPVTNVLLAALFFVLIKIGILSGLILTAAAYGIIINLILAAFNMIPFGPLDGAKVFRSSPMIWALAGLPMILLGLVAIFAPGLLLMFL
ncbi:site-2 protease family protein [Methanocella sp. MCL-LM]|uniref:site-2 protease family protein n=1 Tax=Methanocella sp. MCL-LM TaxID=3412035 RepID=UPI003C77DF66